MLYIVATPIGNLGEITYRAVEVLKSVDAVLCEDTRRTRILFSHYGINTKLISYQKYSERAKVDYVLELLREGNNLALVSDAGMPLISDPGELLVQTLQKEGMEYTVVSGACAVISALVLSGLDTSSFLMVGFLPQKKSDKIKVIEKYKDVEATLVFYVPPHDAKDLLKFLSEELGNRNASLVREISKVYEEVVRGRIAEFPDFNEKGEMVLVVEGAKSKPNELCALSIVEHVDKYRENGMDKKSAQKMVASDRGISKSEVYLQYERAKKDGKENE